MRNGTDKSLFFSTKKRKTKMADNDWKARLGMVYSTNPDFQYTTDEVEDRKWNGGEVINTLRKFTDEEKAYDVHYDLQQKR